jgi:beta-1,4-N-acetylglucosaminyltransferase
VAVRGNKLWAAAPVFGDFAADVLGVRRLPLRRRGTKRDPGRHKPRALLVCSPGGHLQQMLALRPAWADMDVSWATLASTDVEHILREEDVALGHGPTNRSIKNLLRNLLFAHRLLRRRDPDVILSTGAALAVPFFLLGRLRGTRLVYVESLTRTEGPSLTGRLVAPLADVHFVQWPNAVRDRALNVGSILTAPEDAPTPTPTPTSF